MRFSAAIFSRLVEGAGGNSLQGACHVTLRLSVKFRPNRFLFAGVIPEKVIVYEYSACLRHIISISDIISG